jgi:hypothetical protein
MYVAQKNRQSNICQESEIVIGIYKALNCQVIVELKTGTPRSVLDEILRYLDGEVIDEIDGWNQYEIKYKKPISVEEVIKYLDSVPQVKNALPNFIMSGEMNP